MKSPTNTYFGHQIPLSFTNAALFSGIEFNDQGECLQLLPINIYNDFEKRVRSLIAYEQCHIGSELRNVVSIFAVFMQCLVQSNQDVKLLI